MCGLVRTWLLLSTCKGPQSIWVVRWDNRQVLLFTDDGLGNISYSVSSAFQCPFAFLWVTAESQRNFLTAKPQSQCQERPCCIQRSAQLRSVGGPPPLSSEHNDNCRKRCFCTGLYNPMKQTRWMKMSQIGNKQMWSYLEGLTQVHWTCRPCLCQSHSLRRKHFTCI